MKTKTTFELVTRRTQAASLETTPAARRLLDPELNISTPLLPASPPFTLRIIYILSSGLSYFC